MQDRRRTDRRVGRPWRRTTYPEAADTTETPKIHEEPPKPDEAEPTRTTTPVPQFTEPTRTAAPEEG